MLYAYASRNELNKALERLVEKKVANTDYLVSGLSDFIVNDRVLKIVDNLQLFELMGVIFWQILDGFESENLWSNSVDPLTFVLGASAQKSSLLKYVQVEISRQEEKSIGTNFGYFHQGLLRIAFADQRPLKDLFSNPTTTTGIYDVLSGDGKIAIEVKSKWNTTKGDTKIPTYKKLFERMQNFPSLKELYFAEIIDKPGTNFTKSNFKIIENNKFWRCDGEYIYSLAAKRQGLPDQESFLKLILIKFPLIIWIYSQLLNEIYQKDHIHHALQTFHQKFKSIQPITKSDMVKLEIFKRLGSKDVDDEILKIRAIGDLKQLHRDLKEYIIRKRKLEKLMRLACSIQSSIELHTGSKEDMSFFNEKLIGHLGST